MSVAKFTRSLLASALSITFTSAVFAAPASSQAAPDLGGISVTDAKGTIIGSLVASDTVLFKAGPDLLLLGVGKLGFTPSFKGAWSYLYTTSNCTGTKYIAYGNELASSTGALIGLAPRVNAVLAYAGTPYIKADIRSAQSVYPTASTCSAWNTPNTPVSVGLAKTINLADFGFVAPVAIPLGGQVTPLSAAAK